MTKAIITMKDGGKMVFELCPEHAPITVKNFVDLAERGFYDDLIFHRIIKNFMIQGGDPEGTGMGGPGHYIKGEFLANGVNNPISHKRGAISMARSSHPNSAGSQFFIVHKDALYLDGQYAAFGNMTEGFDVLDRLAGVYTDGNDRPLDDIVIKTVDIVNE